MPHEGPHHSRLKVAADAVGFAVSSEHNVLVRFDVPQDETTLVLDIAPADARRIAAALIAKAKEAEA